MTSPPIGIIMGSDSDLPTMQEAIATCEEFEILCKIAQIGVEKQAKLQEKGYKGDLDEVVKSP